MDMIAKRTDFSWSFCNNQVRKYIPQSCYETPLFISITDTGIGPYSSYTKVCVKEEKCIPNPHLQNNQKNSQAYIY